MKGPSEGLAIAHIVLRSMWGLGMPTVPVYTADTGTVYTGPYPYRQGSWLLLYGTVYGTGVACKTRSVLRLYGRKYGVIKVAVLPRTILFPAAT